ncbi:glycoside hydrolase family 3 protein [Streptomyces sp. Vc74B-19]|uniref:glycoside hydrolase family 3 protein n=1 Tax=unclassified Streptomyces TaxID=2593676 RepID=UPI001BFC5432|nr:MULTISPECIES: glycoside hydrolase family 3 protein [unclassified Streptomyces]MBT3168048.1 glycoside hydrolase family 3 protein [Streptomyces sp. Vc74B-19]MCO4695053.1 glycoside hydrolase family 3 protein [Streptomyces sp. RO-S4]MDU0303745.1 glycoside hydrolase family 3 protein [Streptomyces sp. PAL114]
MTTFTTGTDTLTRDALAVLQPGFTGTTAPDWVRRRLAEGLASVALFGRNVADPGQVAALTAQLRAERDDLLVAIDEESGDVTRLEVRTGSSFPGSHALGAVDDPALTRQVARELGRRLAECGVNLNWAPSADVNANADNPVIGVRSFGHDTALVARHTAAYVEGLQSTGVAACTKHFPGHGDTSVDSHHALPQIDLDATTLHQRELQPFRAAIEAGTRAVMTAHIRVPVLDPDRPATLSRRILTDLLRGELGYDGLIVTDGMEMGAVADTYGLEHGVVLAIAAGADAICVGGGLSDEGTVQRLQDALVTAVRTGELPEERLADAAARVRSLAEWTTAMRRSPASAGDPAPEIGLAAARRAVSVTRAAGPAPVTGPVYVATFSPAPNIAVGAETPWGVGTELERLLPGTVTGHFTGPDAGAEALRAAGGRRVVAVVRDEHRHAWMGAALDTLLAAGPDTAVVEMGVPQATPRGALHIATHGAARVCGVAATEALLRG